MNMIICISLLPIGAEGPECVGHLDHSRGDLSDLITREVLVLNWSLERCWFSLVSITREMSRWSGFLLLERCWFSLVINSRDVNAPRVRWSDLISLERCWFGLVFNSRGVYVSRVTIHLSSLDDISRVRPYISRVICLRPSSEKP